MISSIRHLRLLRRLQPPKLESNPLLKHIILDLEGNIERDPSYYEQDAIVNDIRLSFSIQSNLLFHNTLFNSFVVESPINTYVLTSR